MSLQAYLTVKGQTQGKIEGPVNGKGREHSIAVVAWDFGVITSMDPATGQASGKRQHRPVEVVKPIDMSSVPLFGAYVNNELLISVQLQVWETTRTGTEAEIYVINLTNATIVSFQQSFADRHTAEIDPHELERIAFTYQKMEITWIDGQITFSDSWNS